MKGLKLIILLFIVGIILASTIKNIPTFDIKHNKEHFKQIEAFVKENNSINVKIDPIRETVEIPYCIISQKNLISILDPKSTTKNIQCYFIPYKYIWNVLRKSTLKNTPNSYLISIIRRFPNLTINTKNVILHNHNKLYEKQLFIPISIRILNNKTYITVLELPKDKIKNYSMAIKYIKELVPYYKTQIASFYNKIAVEPTYICTNLNCRLITSPNSRCKNNQIRNRRWKTDSDLNTWITHSCRINSINIDKFYHSYCQFLKNLQLSIYEHNRSKWPGDIPIFYDAEALETPYPFIVNCDYGTIPDNIALKLTHTNIMRLARILYMDKTLSPYKIPHTYILLNNTTFKKQTFQIEMSERYEAWYYFLISRIILYCESKAEKMR